MHPERVSDFGTSESPSTRAGILALCFGGPGVSMDLKALHPEGLAVADLTRFLPE